MNKNFMYGIGAVKYKGVKVGYIGKDSFDLGGVKPESTEIEAEQVPGAPCLSSPIPTARSRPSSTLSS